MFQDEARVGRISEPYACWAPKGVRPKVGAQIVREYAYVYGAVSPQDGCHDDLILPNADASGMSKFLRLVQACHAGDYILMIMDGAGWHKAKDLVIPDRIEIQLLPPYCPDLNPEEQVWDELREKNFANRVFDSMEAVEAAAEQGLRQMRNNPAALASLAGWSWVLDPL
jgi:transposase